MLMSYIIKTNKNGLPVCVSKHVMYGKLKS